MTFQANRKRGEIALPAFGENAYVRLDVDALERIESAYPDEKDSFKFLIEELSRPNRKVIKTCLDIGLRDATENDVLGTEAAPIKEVGDRILDSLLLAYFGRTLAEQTAFEEAEQKRQIEENPLMAAAYLRALGMPDIGQDSVPATSDA